MDRQDFIDNVFADWEQPDSATIDAFIAKAEAASGVTVASISITDPLYGALLNRTQRETVLKLCMLTAERHTFGPIGAASDMFKHYHMLLTEYNREWDAEFKSLANAKKFSSQGSFEVLSPGFRNDCLGRPI